MVSSVAGGEIALCYMEPPTATHRAFLREAFEPPTGPAADHESSEGDDDFFGGEDEDRIDTDEEVPPDQHSNCYAMAKAQREQEGGTWGTPWKVHTVSWTHAVYCHVLECVL